MLHWWYVSKQIYIDLLPVHIYIIWIMIINIIMLD